MSGIVYLIVFTCALLSFSLFHPLATRLPTRPDSSLRYRRYINHLLTYLLTLPPKYNLAFNVQCQILFQNFLKFTHEFLHNSADRGLITVAYRLHGQTVR